MTTFKVSHIENILTKMRSGYRLEILHSDIKWAQKELAVIKNMNKEVETSHSEPTLRDELTKLAPEILDFPAMTDDTELLDLSVFSVCGNDMLIHAVQVNALLKTFDSHSHIQYHLIEALKMQWEIIYYG
ncbi:MAG: hypothetical protein JRE40_00250 [Deltaproteobacteria bacterium]|nr:hypothetical protein [Deltaproteobacteria bacterium]